MVAVAVSDVAAAVSVAAAVPSRKTWTRKEYDDPETGDTGIRRRHAAAKLGPLLLEVCR